MTKRQRVLDQVDNWSKDDCLQYLKDHLHLDFFKDWVRGIVADDLHDVTDDNFEEIGVNVDYLTNPSLYVRMKEKAKIK